MTWRESEHGPAFTYLPLTVLFPVEMVMEFLLTWGIFLWTLPDACGVVRLKEFQSKHHLLVSISRTQRFLDPNCMALFLSPNHHLAFMLTSAVARGICAMPPLSSLEFTLQLPFVSSLL
jgi:hypothetical protein